jgi:hypothetical protein
LNPVRIKSARRTAQDWRRRIGDKSMLRESYFFETHEGNTWTLFGSERCHSACAYAEPFPFIQEDVTFRM